MKPKKNHFKKIKSQFFHQSNDFSSLNISWKILTNNKKMNKKKSAKYNQKFNQLFKVKLKICNLINYKIN